MSKNGSKYALRISKKEDKIYKIRLVKTISRAEETVFEFLSSKVPKTRDVIEIYHANTARR
jgi:hypothetical protein